jgi:predicted RNA polymerase sigma factor
VLLPDQDRGLWDRALVDSSRRGDPGVPLAR